MALQYFEPTATADEIATATHGDGGAIVKGLVSAELSDKVAGEMRLIHSASVPLNLKFD